MSTFEAWLALRHTRADDAPELGRDVVRVVRRRPWFTSMVVAANVALMRLAGSSAERCLALLAVAALPIAIGFMCSYQARAAARMGQGFSHPLFATDLFIPALLALTGGLRSPFVPVLLASVTITTALWRRQSSAWLPLVSFVVTLAILFVLPVRLTGPAIPSPYFGVMMATNLVASLYFSVQMIWGLSEGFISTKRRLNSVCERTLAAAAQRPRSLEQVGSKVAHELKNPLAAIKSLLQLEESGARDERSRRRFETMTREVARMEAVLREYLTFARPIEDLRVAPVDLAALADNVVVLLEGRAAAAGIQLERQGEAVPIAGDARRLEEALLNLAANAIDATPAGGQVTIRTERRPTSGVVFVHDTGKGMTEAVLEKVGTPFYTTKHEGTGLGVVLARAAVIQHGGRLDLVSRPGGGTTATITLPDCVRTSGAIHNGHIHGSHSLS